MTSTQDLGNVKGVKADRRRAAYNKRWNDHRAKLHAKDQRRMAQAWRDEEVPYGDF